MFDMRALLTAERPVFQGPDMLVGPEPSSGALASWEEDYLDNLALTAAVPPANWDWPKGENGDILPNQWADLRCVPEKLLGNEISAQNLVRNGLATLITTYRKMSPETRSLWSRVPFSYGGSTSHIALAALAAGCELRSVMRYALPGKIIGWLMPFPGHPSPPDRSPAPYMW